MSELMFSHEIAARLGWNIQTFRNRKRALVEDFDFPAPAALPGRARWLAADIDAWLAGRGRAGRAEPAPTPAATVPAATAAISEPATGRRRPGRPRNEVVAGGRG